MWGLLTLLVLVLLVASVVLVIVRVRGRSQDPTLRPARDRLDGWTPPSSSGASTTGVARDDAEQGPAATARQAAPAGVGGDAGLDEPAAPIAAGATSNRADPPQGPPLPVLVRGLTWPHGLTPHVAPDQPDTDQYLAMVTTEATGSEVAASLQQELERLGYEVMALSEEDLVARRDEDLLSGRVHGRAGTANTGGRQLFPTAAPNAVAVELWAGGGPNPRLT